MPSGWPSAATMSASYAPGGDSTASDVGSTTATSSAPVACAASASSDIGSSCPKKFGCAATRHATSSPSAAAASAGSVLPAAPAATSTGTVTTSTPGPEQYVWSTRR